MNKRCSDCAKIIIFFFYTCELRVSKLKKSFFKCKEFCIFIYMYKVNILTVDLNHKCHTVGFKMSSFTFQYTLIYSIYLKIQSKATSSNTKSIYLVLFLLIFSLVFRMLLLYLSMSKVAKWENFLERTILSWFWIKRQ